MLKDEKILVTGPAGRIAYGLCRSLAKYNEVRGITLDIANADFADLPEDFSTVLHAGYKGIFELELLRPAIEHEGYASTIRRSVDWMPETLTRLGA
jgi:nucleoside-diphosphate-sugar epimerase